MEKVILVNSRDESIGEMEKLEAHEKGLLHRAFSVILFNNKGEMLLQKRADGKYHSAGLWTNTCCSHPRPGEKAEEAAKRRLKEEMDIEAAPEFLYKFIYKTKLDHGLIEHEYDYVFVGTYDGEPTPNPSEVSDWKYVPLETLNKDIANNPHDYTVWFRIIMENLDKHYVQTEI